MKKKIAISLALGGLLSAATLYLAFYNVPVGELVAYMGRINYWWLFPAMLLVVATFVLRVLRWRIILMDAGQVDFWQAFHPLMIGFMINCVLPGRVGELARPVILKKNNDIPVSTGLATVAAERVMDIVALIVLFAIILSTMTIQSNLEARFGSIVLNPDTLKAIAWTMIRLSLVLLAGIAALTISWSRELIIRFLRKSGRWLNALTGQEKGGFTDKSVAFCIGLVENFAIGLQLVRSPARLSAGVLLTAAIWFLSVLAYYVFALGCPGITITVWQMTAVLVITCFFIALPSVPGFWGLWEAGGVFALSIFGVSGQEAAGFTLVNHAIQMFPVILIGLVSAVMTSVNIFKVTYGAESAQSTVPSA